VNSTSVTFVVDLTLPEIAVTYPENISYNVNVSELNYTYSDTNPGSCWYSEDSGASNSSSVNAGENFTEVISIEGSNTWIVYCNDSAGNVNVSSVIFVKDTLSPEISNLTYVNITRDINGTIELGTNLTINVTVVDNVTGVSNVWTTIWQGAIGGPYLVWQYLTNTIGNIWTTDITTNASYTTPIMNYTVYANDSLGNEVNQSSIFSTSNNAPLIDFVSPTENSGNILKESIFVNVTASDQTLASITINLYNSTDLVNSSNSATSPWFTNFTGLFDAVYYFNATACDSVGNCNSTETRNVTVDKVNPQIQLIYPQNTTYNINISSLNYTAYDANINSCWYTLNNGQSNVTISCNQNVTGLTSNEGPNTWIVYVNDIVGNVNSSNVTFFKDTISPNISFVAPTEGSGVFLNKNNILANITSTDDGIGLANITISLYNSTGLYNSTTTTDSELNLNFTGLVDGIYYFNATACDILNNCNYTETRNVTVDLVAPTIQFDSPTETSSSIIGRKNILVNISSVDSTSGLASITLRLYDFGGLINTTVYSISPLDINFTLYSDGTYYFNATACDNAGNCNDTETRNVAISTGAPIIYFTNQTEPSGSYLNRTNIIVNVSANSTYLANVTLDLYNSTGIVNSTTLFTSPLYMDFIGLVDGVYYFNATACDVGGNCSNTLTNIVTIDTIKPIVDFVSPTDASGSTIGIRNYIYVNVSATEINIANITVNLYSSANTLINSTTSTANPYFVETPTFGDGVYYFNATACDLAGNCNDSETRNVTMDTTPPNVTIISPANAIYPTKKILVYLLNSSDSQAVWWGNGIANFSYTGSGIYNFSEGSNTFYAYANDSLGNIKTETVSFTVTLTYAIISNSSVSPSVIINGTSVNLSLSASNYNSIWAVVTMPDGATQTVALTNNANVIFANTSLDGRYNVTFYANSSSEAITNTSTYFESFRGIQFNANVTDYNNGGVGVNWTAYYGSVIFRSNSYSYGNVSDEIIDTLINLEFKAYLSRLIVKLYGINATSENNKIFGMDKLASPISGYLVTYGISNNYTITNATIRIYYDNLGYSDESKLKLHKCSNWSFAGESCLGSWEDITSNSTKNTVEHYFEYITTSFSGFSIMQESVPQPPGGGGGGGGGACVANYVCGEWSACRVNNTQTRACHDISSCKKANTSEIRNCTYVPEKPTVKANCYDNIWNNGESDVDCGGSCGKCNEGRTCRLGEDCGTGYCESGICTKKIEKNITAEEVSEIKEKKISIWNLLFWVLILALLGLILLILLLVIRRARGIFEAGKIFEKTESVKKSGVRIATNKNIMKVSQLDGKEVYTESGEFFGTVKHAVLGKDTVYGLKIKLGDKMKKRYKLKKVSLRYGYVSSISQVIMIKSNAIDKIDEKTQENKEGLKSS
jgi:sporulation protein YlmC with PRC-barrel domain